MTQNRKQRRQSAKTRKGFREELKHGLDFEDGEVSVPVLYPSYKCSVLTWEKESLKVYGCQDPQVL
jgi:hypothetical protein